MEREQEIARTVYKVVAADVGFLFAFVLVVANDPAYLEVGTAVFLPCVLIANFLFLRRGLRRHGPPVSSGAGKSRTQSFWLYACSCVFFFGTLYGLLTILRGGLPKAVLPGLLIPLLVALYCLKTARQIGGWRRH